MEHISYKTQGTCSRQIDMDIENGVIVDAKFTGGCSGNTQGVACLVKGMKVEEVIARLKGIQCRAGTSCPDQLATALKEAKQAQ